MSLMACMLCINVYMSIDVPRCICPCLFLYSIYYYYSLSSIINIIDVVITKRMLSGLRLSASPVMEGNALVIELKHHNG